MSSAGKNYTKSYTTSCRAWLFQSQPDQIKASNELLFFISFFKGSSLVHGEKYFSTFFICCESTPTRLTHSTTFGHEIVNNVENTCVTNVFRFRKWLLKSCIWCFPMFCFVLMEHVCVCVCSLFYTGGALEWTFQFICKIWTKDICVMIFLNILFLVF